MFKTSDPAEISSIIDQQVLRHLNFHAVRNSLIALAGDSPLTVEAASRHCENISHAPAILTATRRTFPLDKPMDGPVGFVGRMNEASAAGLKFAEEQLSQIAKVLSGPAR